MGTNSRFNQQDEETPFLLPNYNEILEGPFNPLIYQKLPLAMQGLFTPIANQKERDILLLGMLTVLSGCMPNVTGHYDRKWIYPNLYTFIEAPAGAGKGVLSWARLIGTPVHKQLCEETKIAREQYELLRKENSKQKNAEIQFLKEPPTKMLFIPVNNSASSIVQTLTENEGSGILFSTEADTLANSLAQDWGNFSDVLRCAFHHEPIDLQRRLNREYLSIEEPKLSVLLTGTKGQLLRLIPNTENGLFSRFMYYSFPVVPHFRNVFDQKGTDPGQAFKTMGHTVLEMYNYLKALPQPIQLYLVEEDRKYFFEQFTNITRFTYKDSGPQILATVHRLGLITFRMAMIFSIYRHFSNPKREELTFLKIHKNDFDIATELTYHILYHSTLLVSEMKDGSKQILQQSKLMSFYNKLPDNFTKTEATQIAITLNISNATLGRYLINPHFERTGQGKYRKILINQGGEQMSSEQMSKIT